MQGKRAPTVGPLSLLAKGWNLDVEISARKRERVTTATVKSIELAAFMEQAGSDYVLAGRVLHTGSIVLTHAVVPSRYGRRLPMAREEGFFDELARGLADGSVTRGKALRLMSAALLGARLHP